MDIQKQIEINPVLKDVQNVLIEQTVKGLKKYGTTVSYESLTASDWIEHSKQETADKLVYLTCLEKSLGLLEAKARAFDNIHGILCDLEFAGTLTEEMAIEYIGNELKEVFKNNPIQF